MNLQSVNQIRSQNDPRMTVSVKPFGKSDEQYVHSLDRAIQRKNRIEYSTLNDRYPGGRCCSPSRCSLTQRGGCKSSSPNLVVPPPLLGTPEKIPSLHWPGDAYSMKDAP
jgi:hypothetical protein